MVVHFVKRQFCFIVYVLKIGIYRAVNNSGFYRGCTILKQQNLFNILYYLTERSIYPLTK